MNLVSHQVVVQTAFLGDLFLSIPLLRSIRAAYPNDKIVLICKKGLGDYFLKENFVDVILEVKKNSRSDYSDVKKELNKLKIHNLFCVHRSIRSQLFCWQVKAGCKIGFKSFLAKFIFNKVVEFKNSWPEPFRQLWIMSAVDFILKTEMLQKDWSYLNKSKNNFDMNPLPEKYLNSSVKNSTAKKICLFPGSVWATKKWTEIGFCEVGDYFLKQGYEVYLMGGPDEQEICQRIHAKLPLAQVLAGQKTIMESIEFIKLCDLVVCNDSAPAHMAASVATDVVAIFGPTTLNLGFRPWTDRVKIVQNKSLNCRPCGKHGHHECPLQHHHCMTEIKASDVIEASLELLKANR